MFGVYFVAEPEKLQPAMQCLMANLTRLGSDVTEDELVRAKTSLKANMMMQVWCVVGGAAIDKMYSSMLYICCVN